MPTKIGGAQPGGDLRCALGSAGGDRRGGGLGEREIAPPFFAAKPFAVRSVVNYLKAAWKYIAADDPVKKN
eukprot:2036079-Pyramimonas_sp.AAC.1